MTNVSEPPTRYQPSSGDKVRAWAWDQKGISGTAQHVLLAIANWAGPNAEIFPSQKHLAAMCNYSDKTVYRVLKELEEAGLIRRERRHRSNGTRTSDQLFLNYDLITEPEPLSVKVTSGQDDLEDNLSQGELELPVITSSTTRQDDDAVSPKRISQEEEQEPAPRAPRERARNPIWDAVVEVCELDPSEITRQEAGRIAVAVKQLNAVGATVEQIHRRGEVHKRDWPNHSLTATSLASNWALLGTRLKPKVTPLTGHDAFLDLNGRRMEVVDGHIVPWDREW